MKKEILISLLLLSGCASQKPYLKQDYSTNALQASSLALVFVNGMSIEYEGNVRDEFGNGDTDDLIADFVLKMIVKKFRDSSCIKSVFIIPSSDIASLTKHRLCYESTASTIDFLLPDSGKPVFDGSPDADFVLLLEEFEIRSELKIGVTVMKPLAFRSKYVIWDNKLGCLVAFGDKVSISFSSVAVTMPNWEEAIGVLVRDMLVDTPFLRIRK